MIGTKWNEWHCNLVEFIAISWKFGTQSCQFLYRNESLGSHISMSLKQGSYKSLHIYKINLINLIYRGVVLSLYDKYEKFFFDVYSHCQIIQGQSQV